MRRAIIWLPWILLAAAIAAFLTWHTYWGMPKPQPTDGLPHEQQKALVQASPQGGVVSYNEAVRVAAPAVVNIYTKQKVKRRSQIDDDPVLRKFFERQFPSTAPHDEDETSLGSGVIVSPDGYILTNNHVIEQADQIIVALQDGRHAVAKLVGTDSGTDLAVIKVDLQNLPVLPFKTSPSLVGDVVLAIGNPFGVGQTVTQGIISALGRRGLGINTYEDFIQTDAAINPGNSGGALIDVAGNLVGINTAIFSRTGGSLGIGFAIPASLAQQVLQAIMKDGRVTRGWLGIEVKELDPVSMIEETTPETGVRVMGVLLQGPAAAGGLQKGDIIVSINKQSMQTANQLIQFVAQQKPGSTIAVDIQREGQQATLNIKIGERPAESAQKQQLPSAIE